LHLAVDAHGMPVKFVLSEGGAADCLFAEALIADTTADKLKPLQNSPKSYKFSPNKNEEDFSHV